MRSEAPRNVTGGLGGWRALGPAAIVAALALASAGCASDPSEKTDQVGGPTTPLPRPGLESAGVVNVVDGVTIEVEVGGQVFEVKYLGVDLPVDEGSTGARMRALEFNRFLVEGDTVDLERGSAETDELGRLLRYVYADGEMVNMALVANGHAEVSDFPAEFVHRGSFQVAEQSAKRDRKGLWARTEPSSEEKEESPAGTPSFTGGTLPPRGGVSFCDFSGTSEPVIKGNVDSRSGDRIYHVPGGFFYSTTVVDADSGDMWLCTEEQAMAAGWKRSAH